MIQIIAIAFGVLTLLCALFSIRLWQQVRGLSRKYQPVIDVEAQLRLAGQKLEEEKRLQQALVTDAQRARYQTGHSIPGRNSQVQRVAEGNLRT